MHQARVICGGHLADRRGAQSAARVLKLGMIEDVESLEAKLQARSLRDRGILQQGHIPIGDSWASGYEGGFKLTEVLMKRKKRFTALFAFDDMTALGAVRGLARSGLRVPEDCSVVGFDDVIPAGLSVPSLTTVRQPMEALGRAAVEIVLESINAAFEERDSLAVHRKLAPELVVRETTRAVKS